MNCDVIDVLSRLFLGPWTTFGEGWWGGMFFPNSHSSNMAATIFDIILPPGSLLINEKY